MLRNAVLLVSGTIGLFVMNAAADEGMWMPQQIPALAATLKQQGFTGNPEAFADLTGHPMGAVVSLGGCSASFISPEGLIATNHHCVQGALQFNSSPERNLMQDGYLAKERSGELTAGPGSRVFVTMSVADVTEAIRGSLPQGDDRQLRDEVEKRIKARVAACEKDGLRCSVSSFYLGSKYYEIAQLEIQDVRLVYAPPAGIGNFGGETDNWRWPRHTGDFSLYRAYVSPSGKPAPYAPDNVPYRPKHWLRVSPKGASPGEFVFVAGYPGRTFRLQPYGEIRELVEWSFPRLIRRYQDQIRILEEIGKQNKETQLRVSTRLRGLNNTLTNRKGVLEGLTKGGLLAQKQSHEADLRSWIAADPNRQKRYGKVLDDLAALRSERQQTRERDATLNDILGPGLALGTAHTLYTFALERQKPDADREPEFQQRNWSRIRETMERLQRSLDPAADRVLMKYFLAEAAALPAGQRIEAVDKAFGLAPGMDSAAAGRAIDAGLDRLYSKTGMFDKTTRMAMLDKSPEEIAKSGDTVVDLAVALHPLWQAVEDTAKTRQGAMLRLGPVYARALLEKQGGLVAPDANSTLRVTYGTVKGVAARDGLFYLPQTTVNGIVEKHTGEGEFDAPKRQLDAIAALRAGKKSPYVDPRLGTVPVNFLSTVDTTGGNSGSATLNSKGELIGLLFDGTYDTVASDYLYDRVKTRSIHVDTRYLLWTLSDVENATHLLREIQAGGQP